MAIDPRDGKNYIKKLVLATVITDFHDLRFFFISAMADVYTYRNPPSSQFVKLTRHVKLTEYSRTCILQFLSPFISLGQ